MASPNTTNGNLLTTTLGMEISEPVVLTRLPRAAGGDSKHTFAQVVGLKGSVRRKRHEVCVAVDGDSVNTYEVQDGNVISSCPVAPDTEFLCSPYSLRYKSGSGSTVRRTYCVSRRRNDTHVHCYVHNEQGGSNSVDHSRQLSKPDRPIVHLEALDDGTGVKVVTLQDDGLLTLLAADMDEVITETVLTDESHHRKFLAAQWFTSAEAAKSILRARQDIHALNDPSTSFLVAAYIAVQASGKASIELRVGVWTISHSKTNPTLTESRSALDHKLLDLSTSDWRPRDVISILSAGTRISVLQNPRHVVFDLTTVTPRKLYDQPMVSNDQLCSLHLSENVSLCSIPGGLRLYNSHFRSLIGSYEAGKSGNKRPRNNNNNNNNSNVPLPTGFIAYLPRLGRVIGIRRNYLIAIDLRPVSTDIVSALHLTNSLVNNIGRGIVPAGRGLKNTDKTTKTAFGSMRKVNASSEEWIVTARQMDEYVQANSLESFDDLFLTLVSGPSESNRSSRFVELPEFKVSYILSKLFAVVESYQQAGRQGTSPKLSLVLHARQTLQWLVTNGCLGRDRLKRALAMNIDDANMEIFDQCFISGALFDADPTLELLELYVKESVHLEAQELCQSVLILLTTAMKQSSPGKTLTIEDYTGARNLQQTTDNGDDKQFKVASQADPTQSIFRILTIALERFSRSGSKRVTRLMRSSFGQHEIIALIQILRQHLFRNGYTRSMQTQSYQSPPTSLDDQTKPGELIATMDVGLSLNAIVELLSNCIDVIGPVGMLGSSSESDFIQQLVPDISSEIYRVTEALEDATFLQGLLREILRFSHEVQRQKVGSTPDVKEEAPEAPAGTILTVFAENRAEAPFKGDHNSLPLGLGEGLYINRFRSRKGGGQVQRSSREMGMLHDRSRGPYAIERLVL